MNTKNSLIASVSIASIIGVWNIAVAAVPHTFSAGSPAKASEVNENFSNLDARVNTLEATSSTTSTDISNLGGRVTTLESNSSNTATSINDLGTRTTTLESSSAAANTNIGNLNARATALEAGATTTNSSIGDLNTRTTNLESSSSNASVDISDLQTRVTTLESSATTPVDNSNFTLPFAADGAQKNVIVLRSTRDDGGTDYFVRSRYANSSEQISVNGVQTVRPFIANYAYAATNSTGVLIAVSNYIEAPETSAYVNYLVEESTYNPAAPSTKTVTADNTRETWKCDEIGEAVQCIVVVVASNGGTFQRAYDWSYLRGVVPGPTTLGSMVFSQDLQINNFVSTDRLRIRARGIGEVYRETTSQVIDTTPNPDVIRDKVTVRTAIYYHVNGATAGSLAGTPFAPGQPLDGLFF